MGNPFRRIMVRILKRIAKRVVPLLPPQAGRILSHLPDSMVFRYAPFKLMVEPANDCNLKCPLCAVTTTMTRTRGFMTFPHFKHLVDTLPSSVTELALYGWGEALLNEEVFEMVRYASQQGFHTQISTNATTLDRHADAVLDSGLSELIVCLDGATKETQEKYRVGSDFAQVTRGIRLLCERKKAKGAPTEIILQFLVFRHNQHEVGDMVRLSKELGVDHLALKKPSIITYDSQGIIKTDNAELKRLAVKWLPEDSRFRLYDFVEGGRQVKVKEQMCYWAWQSAVNWNGDVTSCCMDPEGVNVVGNVFLNPEGFDGVWKSPAYVQMRKKVLRRETPICGGCPVGTDMHVQIF
ncbi:MAG: radical SAM protein [Halobacteria archaeon]